jgi:excisionase family DNA binding protein
VGWDAKSASVYAETVTERPRLLSIRELASYLNVPVQTLYVWRYNGDGPRGIKVGRHVRYRPEDVEEWLEERTAKASGNPGSTPETRERDLGRAQDSRDDDNVRDPTAA